ncbi:Biopolymer transport protein ExbD/TolR [alpha proteobacterium BAL199]|jgi:biopolymer transport protein ExbD|nr:Biopolymer transport protein ExbD/TolR [alpha proteobacterium BAL199]
MRLAHLHRTRTANEDDRILPLINVVFLLLIFFMVVGSLSATDPFTIEPPQSRNGDPRDLKGIVLLIGTDGQLALDGRVLEASALKSAMTERLVDAPAQEVHLKADGAAAATEVVGIMEILRDAGVERVRLMTVPGSGQ